MVCISKSSLFDFELSFIYVLYLLIGEIDVLEIPMNRQTLMLNIDTELQSLSTYL